MAHLAHGIIDYHVLLFLFDILLFLFDAYNAAIGKDDEDDDIEEAGASLTGINLSRGGHGSHHGNQPQITVGGICCCQVPVINPIIPIISPVSFNDVENI